MAGKSKLLSLKDSERRLVHKYIETTDLYDYEFLTQSHVLDLARQLGIPAPIRRNTLDALCRQEIFSQQMDDQNITVIVRIHPEFNDEAGELYLGKQDKQEIPASDRFVSIGDNQPILEETKEALAILSDAIRGSNELFASAEERLQVSKEIDYVNELIKKPRIHVIAVWDAAKNNRNLKWLIEQGISGVIREAAVKALEHLDKLIHFISSL